MFAFEQTSCCDNHSRLGPWLTNIFFNVLNIFQSLFLISGSVEVGDNESGVTSDQPCHNIIIFYTEYVTLGTTSEGRHGTRGIGK